MNKRVFAITGGIGCGKSVVSDALRVMGYPVYDTDRMAKVLMSNSPELRTALCNAFGADTYTSDGQLNRPVLAAKVFADASALSQLNAIVHPFVGRDMLQWIEQQSGADIVFYESAILFESHFDRFADAVWCVTAPLELRIARTMLRDHASREKIMERIDSQMPQPEKEKRSDYVLINDERHSIVQQIHHILSTIPAPPKQ